MERLSIYEEYQKQKQEDLQKSEMVDQFFDQKTG